MRQGLQQRSPHPGLVEVDSRPGPRQVARYARMVAALHIARTKPFQQLIRFALALLLRRALVLEIFRETFVRVPEALSFFQLHAGEPLLLFFWRQVHHGHLVEVGGLLV